MKMIHKSPIPACDICQAAVAFCDAPAKPRGSWAYMCRNCYDHNASANASKVGFEFTSEPDDCTVRSEKIALAIEDGDFELAQQLVGDGDLLEYL